MSKRYSFTEREDQLIEAALELFSKQGFEGTTTKAIAEAAKINEALLYRHFPSKEKLYTAMIEKKIFEWKHNVIPNLAVTSEQPIPAALLTIAKTIVKQCKKELNVMRVLMFAALEGHHFGNYIFKKKLPLYEFMESFFQERMKRDEIRESNPLLTTKIFLTLIFHYIWVTEVFGAKNFFSKSAENSLTQMIEIFLQGVQK